MKVLGLVLEFVSFCVELACSLNGESVLAVRLDSSIPPSTLIRKIWRSVEKKDIDMFNWD